MRLVWVFFILIWIVGGGPAAHATALQPACPLSGIYDELKGGDFDHLPVMQKVATIENVLKKMVAHRQELDQLPEMAGHFGHPLEIEKIQGTVGARKLSGGDNNDSVYSYRSPDGTEHVVKVLKDSPPEGTIFFLNEMAGHYLGEKQGGPKILGFGVTKEPGRIHGHYYVEMERAFAGEHSETLKKYSLLGAMPGEVERMPDLLLDQDRLTHLNAAEGMADLMLRAFADHVVPTDPDFIVSARGKVRWIDTAFWKRRPPGESFANLFGARFVEVSGLLKHDKAAARSYLKRFVSELRSLRGPSVADREALLRHIFRDESITSLAVSDELIDRYLKRF